MASRSVVQEHCVHVMRQSIQRYCLERVRISWCLVHHIRTPPLVKVLAMVSVFLWTVLFYTALGRGKVYTLPEADTSSIAACLFKYSSSSLFLLPSTGMVDGQHCLMGDCSQCLVISVGGKPSGPPLS